MGQLQPTYIANALSGVQTPGERRRLVNQLAAEKGVSPQSIYTAAKKGGFISGRSRRADAGTIKLEVTEDQLNKVAHIIHASHTEKNRIPLPAHEAIRLAESDGLIPPGVVSEAYLNQWMHRRKISKKDALKLTPHIRLMSERPNHCHMIDASQCAQWYINNKGTVDHQRRGMDVYKNKAGDPRKITRTILVDHYSGAFFVWYQQTETALDWVEFVYLAWAEKSFLADRFGDYMPAVDIAAVFPFHGMPEMIYADNGSPIRAAATANVLDNLGITFKAHMPYTPRAKGANETMQRHWEVWFESRLHLDKAISLEQLNARAFIACAEINANKPHARHKHTRFDLWTSELTEIRKVPDYHIYRNFAQSIPELRKVGRDCTITYNPPGRNIPKGRELTYRVPDVNLIGTKVLVNYCLYDYPTVRIASRRTNDCFVAKPLYRDKAGFLPEISGTIGKDFKSHPKTEIQKAFEAHDFTIDKHGLWKSAQPLALENVHVAAPAEIAAGPRLEATQIPVIAFVKPEDAEVRTYTRVQAKHELLERLGVSHAGELHPVQQQLIDTIPPRISHDDLLSLHLQLTELDDAQIIFLEGAAQA